MSTTDWIKVRKKLWDDGRVRILSRKLRTNRGQVLGALVRMWSLADDYAEPDGHMPGYTRGDLDAEVGIAGWCDALPDDWFREDAFGIYLPNYQEHNGETAKRRAEEAKRKRDSRASGFCPEKSGQVSANSRTKTGPEKRREDKRREEKKTTPPNPPSGEVAAEAACPFDSVEASPRQSDLVGPDTSGLLSNLFGFGRVSPFLLDSVGGLVQQYGEDVVQRGIRICIKAHVANFKYLETVCRNGANEDRFIPGASEGEIDKQVEAAMSGIRRAKK